MFYSWFSSSSSTPTPASTLPTSPPVREAGGPSSHPRGLEFKSLSDKEQAEELMKSIRNSPDNSVSQGLAEVRDSFSLDYSGEDREILQQWKNDAMTRSAILSASLGGISLATMNYFKPQFLTRGRKVFLFSAISVWGALVGAISTSPKWLKRITEIDRPDSKIKREVLSVIIKHNPQYFEEARLHGQVVREK